MKWDNFIQILHDADEKMCKILDDFPQYHDFLKRGYLVLTCNNRQFDFTKEPSVYDIANSKELIVDSPLKDNLLNLMRLLKEELSNKKRLQKINSKETKEIEEIDKRIERLELKISSFPLKELEFVDDFDIQVIFPWVNIEAIQAVKNHPLTNKEKTCLCKACIRVFLY